MQAGNIGAAVKLKDVRTGDTLNAKGVDNKLISSNIPSHVIVEQSSR